MSNKNQSTARAQQRSLAGAQNWGQEWDAADVQMLAEFADVTAEELAAALGRSVYAVQSARERMASGLGLGGGNDRQRPVQARTYTFIGDDVPEGW